MTWLGPTMGQNRFICGAPEPDLICEQMQELSAWEHYGPISSLGGPSGADRSSEKGVTPWDRPES